MGAPGSLRSRFTAAAAAAVLVLAAGSGEVAGKPAGGKGKPARKCSSFASQAAAQDYFFKRGGSPGHKVGGLDPDRNGVACERLDPPYKGYVEAAYEERRRFFYGDISTPKGKEGDYPCIYKNANKEITRRVIVYKVRRGRPGLPLSPKGGEERGEDDAFSKGTAPSGRSGGLIWKVAPKGRIRGLFYVGVPQSESDKGGPVEDCPAFRSRMIRLR
jgi:hypothetical protein